MSFIGDNEATNNQQSPPSAAAGVQLPLKGSQDISQAPNNTQQVKMY